MGVLALTSGLAARTWIEPGLWYKYLGVVLWCWIVYALVVFLRPRWSVLRAGVVAGAICLAMECFQITPIPGWLSHQHVVLRWIFGETFSVYDLLAETVAIVLVALIDAGVRTLLPRPGVGSTL
jgi:hypothetical protein